MTTSTPNSARHLHLLRGFTRFGVKVRSLSSLLLTVVLMAALLSMPFAAQSVAKPMVDAPVAAIDNMGDMAGMSEMELMSPDSDCCKQAKSQAPDCAEFCPMVMGCMAKCSPTIAIRAGIRLQLFARLAIAAPYDDGPAAKSPATPPFEPPRA